MKSNVLVGKRIVALLFLTVFVSGCTQQAAGSTKESETLLNKFQGIAVLQFAPLKAQLLPGASTYLQLRIRNNALGKTARNVTVRIEGLGLYHLLDCVSNPISSDDLYKFNSKDAVELYDDIGGNDIYYIDISKTPLQQYCNDECSEDVTCGNLYAAALGYCSDEEVATGACEEEIFLFDKDRELRVTEHGINYLFTGDEYDFMWGIKAPDDPTISGIYYKQNIYYTIHYDYSSENYFSVVAMSDEEVNRRRETGESLKVESSGSSTAGPLEVSQVQVPVYFQSVGGSLEHTFVFNVVNRGEGSLAKTVNKNNTLIVTIPEGLEVTDNCKKWWDEVKCEDFEFLECEDTIPCYDLAKDYRILIKRIKPEELVGTFNLQVPFKINPTELAFLRENNIPLKTYLFKVEMNYTYSLEGFTSIHTKPLT